MYERGDARIDERVSTQEEAAEISRIREESGWSGMYFGGTAFKKQRPVADEDLGTAATIAMEWMDVVTTSGMATGEEADDTKVRTFREAIGEAPLALASGVTPENASRYSEVDCFMVATGISLPGSFYDIDPQLLKQLMDVTRRLGIEGVQA